jgi:hypothetical protein
LQEGGRGGGGDDDDDDDDDDWIMASVVCVMVGLAVHVICISYIALSRRVNVNN